MAAVGTSDSLGLKDIMEAVEGVGRGDDKPQCDVALATVMEMWWTRIEPLRYALPSCGPLYIKYCRCLSARVFLVSISLINRLRVCDCREVVDRSLGWLARATRAAGPGADKVRLFTLSHILRGESDLVIPA